MKDKKTVDIRSSLPTDWDNLGKMKVLMVLERDGQRRQIDQILEKENGIQAERWRASRKEGEVKGEMGRERQGGGERDKGKEEEREEGRGGGRRGEKAREKEWGRKREGREKGRRREEKKVGKKKGRWEGELI